WNRSENRVSWRASKMERLWGCQILPAANRMDGSDHLRHSAGGTGSNQAFPYVRLISTAMESRFKSAGSRLEGDHTAENSIISGSSRIGRKVALVLVASAPSSAKSETPWPAAIIDNSVLRPTSRRWMVGVSHLPAARATIRS